MAIQEINEAINQAFAANPNLIYLLIAVLIWKVIWYAIAIWKTIEKKQKIWFIVLFAAVFVLNDVGLLPIIYLIIHREKKKKVSKKKKKK